MEHYDVLLATTGHPQRRVVSNLSRVEAEQFVSDCCRAYRREGFTSSDAELHKKLVNVRLLVRGRQSVAIRIVPSVTTSQEAYLALQKERWLEREEGSLEESTDHTPDIDATPMDGYTRDELELYDGQGMPDTVEV